MNVKGVVPTGDMMVDALDAFITDELKLPRTLTKIGIPETTNSATKPSSYKRMMVSKHIIFNYFRCLLDKG